MTFAGRDLAGLIAPGPLGSLPDRLRCLFMTTPRRTGSWLAEALAADSATRVRLEEAATPGEGLVRMGEQVFDAVLISHEPSHLDALEIVEGLRAGGSDEPLIVLGAAAESELSPLAFEVGADAYVCVSTATTRGLLWLVARAIERRQLLRDNRCMRQADQQRLQHEQREAERLLAEQRSLAQAWDEFSNIRAESSSVRAEFSNLRTGEISRGPSVAENKTAGSRFPGQLPEPLVNHYRELMRAHVIMGSGNLHHDIAQFAELLIQANVSAPAALQMHTGALGELIRGLGNRSARHVLTRADMMALELALRMAEGYQRRCSPATNLPERRGSPHASPPGQGLR